jgi:hypothetical protein
LDFLFHFILGLSIFTTFFWSICLLGLSLFFSICRLAQTFLEPFSFWASAFLLSISLLLATFFSLVYSISINIVWVMDF